MLSVVPAPPELDQTQKGRQNIFDPYANDLETKVMTPPTPLGGSGRLLRYQKTGVVRFEKNKKNGRARSSARTNKNPTTK